MKTIRISATLASVLLGLGLASTASMALPGVPLLDHGSNLVSEVKHERDARAKKAHAKEKKAFKKKADLKRKKVLKGPKKAHRKPVKRHRHVQTKDSKKL